MDVSIITVTWNSAATIAEQIRSVAAGCAGIEYEQLVVDNNSSDATVGIINNQFQRVTQNVTSKKNLPLQQITELNNLGFAAANNKALQLASGKMILFLNPDMRVEPGAITRLAEWLTEHSEAGAIGGQLRNESGLINDRVTPRRFPTVAQMLAIFFKIVYFFPSLLDTYLWKDFNPSIEQTVDSLPGSFLLVRREIIDQLGWAFDPRYFIWFEDVDLCREIKRLGFKVVYTPLVTGTDLVGRSFVQRNLWWKQWHFFKSAVIYFWKWRKEK